MVLFFTIVSYISLYVALAFLALCLATGLYYLAEVAEEFTSTSKKCLQYAIWTVMGVHVCLFVFDRFPFWTCLFGLGSHLVYNQLMKNFPFFSPQSLAFIGSCICFVVNHIVWYMYFTDPFTPTFSLHKLLGFFFLCVWLVPLGFFVTLSVNEYSLPGTGNLGTASAPGSVLKGGRKRTNIVSYLGDMVNSLRGSQHKYSLPSRAPTTSTGGGGGGIGSNRYE
eukprot:GEZU01016352.1.p1 GENE.GEZU01016352.1~~GEZU01016352.1.p1  ORF type:complete len:223 (+),score=53.69 GEZU01016352.1:345-1013(+)